ncbi:MepB family protein [Leuconostoc citreum]|uniref:MepB family protein n=1 Tax=Leuconostoc citreum TaxID=33964 RepID=UPI0002466641|nr:MepB family protein [Leuconostoc citreum]MCS8584432.1 MepB protein [Leuconostoc citreum]MCS8601920.1 MepB protein [Leuconostoc citreum]QGN60121.1 MepB protein [Leuconostoc citreum]TDM32972.1 MepB protein [Leuconostoc citreum]TOY71268.1 MepB protein [Leuconostoc citreum]
MKSFTVLELIANHSNLVISKIQEEKQNSDYEGMTFFLGHHHIRSRLAKKTPTKKGYFVAAWEKDNFNQNKPFDDENSPDLLIISIMDQSKNGVFIFPKSTLVTQKILNSSKTTGKMAFRVYPSWENNLNKTATKTKLWQKAFFIDLSLKIDNQKFSFLLNQR